MAKNNKNNSIQSENATNSKDLWNKAAATEKNGNDIVKMYDCPQRGIFKFFYRKRNNSK